VTPPVSPITKSEAVARRLRESIHVGDYAPGDRLPPQRELATLLGVSRVSVREGLRLLVDEGYVQVRRGSAGGAFVTELAQPADELRRRLRNQRGELDDLVQFRIAVEGRLAHLAAMRSTRQDLAAIREAMRHMRAITNDSQGHLAFRRADAEFHTALGSAGRNDLLNHAVQDARSKMFIPYDILTFDEPRAAVQADHQAIYEAVRDGDAAAAARLMTEHIQRTHKQLLSFVGEDSLEA
jgi:GntR family transcriptional repressor for pyruvate dehydrogenase complex